MTKQGDKKIVVYTIGYEGMDIDKFIRTLEINKIEQILDVREIPISRKVGFSKSKLESRLSADGIRYIHMKELGSPKEIREKLHATHDYKEFFDSYRYYIGSNFSYIQDAWERVLEYRTCLSRHNGRAGKHGVYTHIRAIRECSVPDYSTITCRKPWIAENKRIRAEWSKITQDRR